MEEKGKKKEEFSERKFFKKLEEKMDQYWKGKK